MACVASRVQALGPPQALTPPENKNCMLKRPFDIAASATGLIVLSPVMLVVGGLIRRADGGPALYRARRVGRGGTEFSMLKFRSMVVNGESLGASSTASDDPRTTAVGRWMRRYKLDELPQLWNVFIGDMSLVGPRPQVPWAVERYTKEEQVLLTVRPGITDPASLRFANEGEILRGHADPDKAYFELIHPEKMRLSVEYVKNQSFLGDLLIIFATLAAPLRRQTAEPKIPFQGSSTT